MEPSHPTPDPSGAQGSYWDQGGGRRGLWGDTGNRREDPLPKEVMDPQGVERQRGEAAQGQEERRLQRPKRVWGLMEVGD